MARITKAQARRRLLEAVTKVGKVHSGFYTGAYDLTTNEMNQLVDIQRKLMRIHNKLK